MTKKGKTVKGKNYGGVKTTILLPEDLWERAKVLAVRERKDFRVVVIEALTKHLEKKGGKR